MLISVAELLKYENSEQAISVAVDLSAVSFAPAMVHFNAPVRVEGKMKYAGGVVMLEAVAEGEYTVPCDRCGLETKYAIQFEIRENFVRSAESLSGDSEAVVLDGLSIDLTQTVSDFAFCNLPTKHLCKADCKGLCAVCGKNLNVESCTCKDEEWNPQFEALRGLFD